MTSKTKARVRWPTSTVLVISVVAVGAVGSGAVFLAVDRQQQSHAADVMDQRVQTINSTVRAEMDRYIETTDDLAAAIGAQNHLSATDFTALTTNLSQKRLPGISGVALIVPATDGQTPRLQRLWQARGNRQLRLVAASTAKEHLFSVLARPLDGTVSSTGRDFSQADEPTQAMVASLTRDRVTASLPYVLLKDRGLPTSKQQQAFVLARPIYGGLGTDREGKFQGWLIMGMRGQDFMDETVQRASQDVVDVTLIDDSTPASAAVPLAKLSRGRAVANTGLERQTTLLVAGTRWQLKMRPTAQFANDLGPSRSAEVGGAGVLITLLLALLIGTLSTSRNRALAKVADATVALRADITRRELVEAALREREEELRVMALTDSLTGLANRRAFMDQLAQSHARAVRRNSPVCVLFCDVDHFKTINDTYGHTAGDEVLREVAARLQAHFRTEDTVARLGGDEFAVICESNLAFTQTLIDRVRDALATPYSINGDLIAATVSVGIATPQPGETSTQLLERADSTMYQAKATHRVA